MLLEMKHVYDVHGFQLHVSMGTVHHEKKNKNWETGFWIWVLRSVEADLTGHFL